MDARARWGLLALLVALALAGLLRGADPSAPQASIDVEHGPTSPHASRHTRTHARAPGGTPSEHDDDALQRALETLPRTRVDVPTSDDAPHPWDPSPVSDVPASVRIENTCDELITLSWIDYDGAEREYTRIRPGRFHVQPTFAGHEWVVRSEGERLLARFASSEGAVVVPCADGTLARAHASQVEDAPPASCPICSPRSTTAAAFSVESHCTMPVHLTWRDFRGATRDYGTIVPGATALQHSYVGHRWEVVDDDGAVVARYVVEEDGEHVIACL